MKKFFLSFLALLLSGTTFYFLVQKQEPYEEKGHADEAFEWWYAQRALPGKVIPAEGLTRAVRYTERAMMRSLRKSFLEEPWESIGPDNIGGRVLSLAIDPDSTNILWAGSASGGLWRSATGGVGAKAWEYVNTGFYLLSVSTIAISEKNPNEMYVGTGEISGYNLGQVGTPGARTTYGLGIIKSTDRGTTWSETGLTWLFSQNRSVQKIVINPKNPNTIFAATSEGTYRSYDAGATFMRVHDTLMAMDVVLNPVDTSVIYVACGQRNTAPNPGLYKSTDGGGTFTKLSGGLPTANFGRTSLAISPSNPNIVYASIADAVSHALAGLYRTTNDGTTWEKMSSTNYLSGQGWYDNICAVHPTQPDVVFAAGLDAYKSTTGGSGLTQKTYWYKDYEGVVPAGGPEGPNDYAHADHHAIIFDPKNPNRMFFGTDGGVFESTDGGETFAGRNGGFVTTQFYNGFDNAADDSLIALGGLQDNGTVKWEGQPSWNKVYGGDGGWCAIDPTNNLVMYEEYVYLTIAKTTDGGNTWKGILSSSSDSSNFIAPFVISPSNPNTLYAGTKKVLKTTNGGESWFSTNNNQALNGTNISCIAVSYTSSDTAIAATGQRFEPIKFEIFSTTNGGTTWTKSESPLPNRYPTDLAFDLTNSRIAYAVFSGYGTSHVYKSTDAGKTWSDISSDLPDIPTQSVCVDPLNPSDIYVGTDLGVYRTLNGGINWEPWFDGMPYAMVLDVGYSPIDRRIRAATFGNGVYQRKLGPKRTTSVEYVSNTLPQKFSLSQNYPNPFNPTTTFEFTVALAPTLNPSPKGGGEIGANVSLKIYDVTGKEVATLVDEFKSPGTYRAVWNASNFSSGLYFARMTAGQFTSTRKLLLMK